MTSKIQYYPKLSIHENAIKNGVSEDAIRYFIRTRKIDRRYERKVNIVNEIRAYLKEHPNATKDEVSKATKHGINTIRDYWEVAKGKGELQSVFGKGKKPRIDVREVNNFYATHPSTTRDILKVETFGKEILEPFCGSGTMSEVIKQSGRIVKAYDIIDRGYGEVGDFFEVDFEKNKYDIITNPPYYEALPKLIKRCIDIAKNKVAIIMPLRYLSGKTRFSDLYEQFPPSRVYVYQERIGVAKNADFDRYNDAGANLEIYAWFIWQKGFKGKTELKWLLNGD
jgi:hypothetical protein